MPPGLQKVEELSDMEMRSDARRFQPVDIDAPARIEFIQSRKRKIMETGVSNISAAGAFFPALKSISPGKQVKVEIFLLFGRIDVPYEQDELITISTTAVVTRSSHSGTAVAFAEDYRMTSSQIFGDLLVTQEDGTNIRMDSEEPTMRGRDAILVAEDELAILGPRKRNLEKACEYVWRGDPHREG